MSDVFISYARSTAQQAQAVADALRSFGYSVWRDDELPSHRTYSDVIEEQLQSAKAVVVVWSAEAVKSQWVQSEADRARETHKLVQLTVDGARLPMPFDRIQCADLAGWAGDLEAQGWKKVAASVADLVGGARPSSTSTAELAPTQRRRSICVLPFANMSDDPQQEYFSDGITEDIITDLSKVSALGVIARNTAFQFKGKSVDVPQVAQQLNVSHVLEGSVRKAGARVRITAQLIDGASGEHVWAERYDRDLTDIFALQDEISEAIVAALKLQLLPQEKRAIERRGTESAEAYDLYLMARAYQRTGNEGDPRMLESVERLVRQAVEIDPGYAEAWSLIASAQSVLRSNFGRAGDGGEAALNRALALDPDLAEARAQKAVRLAETGALEASAAEIAIALRLDPESYGVNANAAVILYRQGRSDEAIPYFEKAVTLDDTALSPISQLISCYGAKGDQENLLRVARNALARAERVVAADPSNGAAMDVAVSALAALGEHVRAKDWMRRALLVDPDNQGMRYNFACTLATALGDPEAALAMLGPVLARDAGFLVKLVTEDPDFAGLRGDPRFQAMVTAAQVRIAAGKPDNCAAMSESA